jgi:hypothetical protein
VGIAIDLAGRAGAAIGSGDPVRIAIRIHPETLTGRATDLTLEPKPGEASEGASELTLQKRPSYTGCTIARLRGLFGTKNESFLNAVRRFLWLM